MASKATLVAEIVTRAAESFGTVDGYVDQARATLPATNAIFYTPSERELIGRLWRFGINRDPAAQAFCWSRAGFPKPVPVSR